MESKDRDLNVVLISTYDLGHQPFGLASPAAWLRGAGAHVSCQDLAVDDLDEAAIGDADLISIHVPMHTASRLATTVAQRVRAIKPEAHLCFYGLYASVNESYFRELGGATILGGEFEHGLRSLYLRLKGGDCGPQVEPVISLERQAFHVPDRTGLPDLTRYAYLSVGTERRTIGYTETTRGCKHTCRHCPIVPVYGGKFRTIPRDVVLADIRAQIAAGAAHISFGDPDFLNAPGHALPIIAAMHEEFPSLTYDVIVKVQHLVQHARHIPTLQETGCLFVTSAVESVDDLVLDKLDKRHSRADLENVVASFRSAGLTLSPTFVAFTPWTSLDGYVELIDAISELGLVESVSPVQYAIRLLIPAGSLLLDLDDVRTLVGRFDSELLVFPWQHPDPAVDDLQREIAEIVASSEAIDDRIATFSKVRDLAYARSGARPAKRAPAVRSLQPIPQVSEPWYCCAEPLATQAIGGAESALGNSKYLGFPTSNSSPSSQGDEAG